MLIVIDIGNSNIVIGGYKNGIWKYEWRMETHLQSSTESYLSQLKAKIKASNLDIQTVEKVVLSSVVPSQTDEIFALVEQVFGKEPLLVGASIYPHLPIQIPSKSEIGTDLVANAMAAITRFPNQNCVVVDFGTALTFTTVSKEKQILGVAIAPGIKTAIRALFMNTAQLPEVPLAVPDSVMGRDTFHAIQAGVLIGFEGLVSHLLKRHREELGGDCLVIATGGLSGILEKLKSEFDFIDRQLTMDGLRIIGEVVKLDI